MRQMILQKHLSWWSLHRDENRWKKQHFARTHLNTPGNWSRSVEQFCEWKMKMFELGGIPGCTGVYAGVEGGGGQREKQWTRVQLLPWFNSSGTSFMRVCVCIRPSWCLLADEEALHKDLRGTWPQGSALSHAYTSFSDSVELSSLSADHMHTHRVSMHSFKDGLPVGVLERMKNSTCQFIGIAALEDWCVCDIGYPL